MPTFAFAESGSFWLTKDFFLHVSVRGSWWVLGRMMGRMVWECEHVWHSVPLRPREENQVDQ